MQTGSNHRILSTIPGTLKSLPDLERLLGRALHKTSTPAEFSSLLVPFKDLYIRFGMQADLSSIDSIIYSHDTPSNGPHDDLELDIDSDIASSLLVALLRGAADLRCAAVAHRTLTRTIDVHAASSNDIINLFVDEEEFSDVFEKQREVSIAEESLKNLLPQLANELGMGNQRVEYVHVHNQGEYLIEIPADVEKKAPKTWEKISSTKKVARFRPPQVKSAVAALELAKEHHTACAQKAWKRLLGDFSTQYHGMFEEAIHSLAALDCLNSFASLAMNGRYVRPEFVDMNDPCCPAHPQLHVVQGRHPVLDVVMEGSFVPNDLHLDGIGSASADEAMEGCAVITGPNMGGKSCYIRQAALLVCMAQAGSFVPAASCKLHVFDSIFTRMGAADNIALGRSTFLEELSETSSILSKATSRSLVIIDELGRGTSTRDGMAIAEATLEYIVNKIGCLCLFVTHYPEVAGLHRRLPGVGSYFMAHLMEEDDLFCGDGSDDGKVKGKSRVPRVTFLYRATKGVASASYGLNVAGMAGLPRSVVVKAAREADEAKGASKEHNGGADVGDDDVLRFALNDVVPVLQGCLLNDKAVSSEDVRGVLEGIQMKLRERLY